MQSAAPAMRSIPRRASAMFLAVVVSALCVGATASDAAAPQLSLSTFKWGGVGSTNEAIYYVARAKGYFAAEGLTDERITVPSGNALLAGIASGSLHITHTGMQQLLIAVDQGLPIIGIAAHQKGPNEFGVISSSFAARAGITNSTTPERQLAALRNARIGFGAPSSTTTVVAQSALQKAGLSKSDYRGINLGNGPALLSAFQNGQIDAFFWIPPETFVAEGVRVDFRKLNQWRGINWTGMIVSKQFLAEHRDTTDAFLRAYYRAWLFARDNPRTVKNIVAQHYPNVDPTLLSRSLDVDLANYRGGPLFDFRGYRKALGLASISAGKPISVPMARAVTNAYMQKAIADVRRRAAR